MDKNIIALHINSYCVDELENHNHNVPETLLNVEFLLELKSYLDYRKSRYKEELTKETYIALLAFLADEPEPADLLRRTREHGNKSVRPLDSEGIALYKALPARYRYAVRTSRNTRKLKVVTDTVFVPRSQIVKLYSFDGEKLFVK